MSETTRDTAMVTIERQQEIAWALSTGVISNDLQWPRTRVSRSRHTYLQVEYVKTARFSDKVTTEH